MQEDSGYYIDVCDAHRYIISTIFQGDFMMVPKQKRQRTHVDDVMQQIRNAQSMNDINNVAHENGWVTHGHQ